MSGGFHGRNGLCSGMPTPRSQLEVFLSNRFFNQPIAGAQYHWTHYLAPPSQRRFITWMQGWITWFSWISLLAGVVNIAALIVQTLISASFPDYVPKGWHVTLIIYAMLIVQGLMNQYFFWLLPWMELLAGLLHIITWIIFVSVLVTLAPRHSSEFVFLEKTALSGWNNEYISFNLGMITATWGFVGESQFLVSEHPIANAFR